MKKKTTGTLPVGMNKWEKSELLAAVKIRKVRIMDQKDVDSLLPDSMNKVSIVKETRHGN